jgi:HEAT repeat protein
MNGKHRAALVVSLAVSTLVLGLTSVNLGGLTRYQENEPQNPPLDKLLQDLRFGNESERSAAKVILVEQSNNSVTSRATLIKALLPAIKGPNRSVEFMRNPDHYKQWRPVVELLGTIRAVEAIDDLIECLDCNHGVFSLSPDVFPATRAIIQIGDQAIPALSRAIEDKTPLERYLAAVALAQIGGEKAQVVLEKAARREKDKQLAIDFRNLLKNLNNSNKPKMR